MMNGEEYGGERCLLDLTRDKYLYVPIQSVLDIEIKFFSMKTDEVWIETLQSLKTVLIDSVDTEKITKIRYGVNIINFFKKRSQKFENIPISQTVIPQILKGNTREIANEAKIDELMRHQFKSPMINIKQSILHFKQSIENELMINLEKVDVYDLYKFQKLPEHLPLSTFITMANDFTEFILSFRFKQMPKTNSLCMVINQVTPIPNSKEESEELQESSMSSNVPPNQLLLLSLDSVISNKEQWVILENFSYVCNIEDLQHWSPREVGLWLNYIRTSLQIVPKNKELQQNIINRDFRNIISNKCLIYDIFMTTSSFDQELFFLRFIRHCELLLKYRRFYKFNQYLEKPTFKVCVGQVSVRPSLKTKRPIGRSKAKREDLLNRLGKGKQMKMTSKNIMETKLGSSLYSGQNSMNVSNASELQNRRWAFFIKCLVTPERASDIAWIDYEGIFHLADQNVIAQLYGQMCQKPEMTYDKLSRGLRYDRSGLIDKADKNFCWKFTIPLEEILGISVETIMNKMYKYFKKLNSSYPTEILLKESHLKKNANIIGPMQPLIREPHEIMQEENIERLQELDYQTSFSSIGYMSTDQRINFWISPRYGMTERYEKRFLQGRPVHSVIPNNQEFISITSLNNNEFIQNNFEGLKQEMKQESFNFNECDYKLISEVKEEMIVEYIEENENFNSEEYL